MSFDTEDETIDRIQKTFWVNKRNLTGTDAEIAVDSFSETGNLNILRISLNTYKDSLNASQMTQFNSLNNVLVPVENEYFFERIGSTRLTSKARQESFDGGLTKVTTMTSIIGSNAINAVTPFDDDTITGVIGNQELSPITLLNITYDTPKSLSNGINILTNAVETAIGREALAFPGGITLNKCTRSPNILGDEIYTLPLLPSIAQVLNGWLKCECWVVDSDAYGITNTGNADDCYIFEVEKASSGCHKLLAGLQPPTPE